MRRVWRYGEHLGQRQCPRRQTVWKVRLSEAVYIPMFFKINGEYIDFDRMNLELNTMGDHGEEKNTMNAISSAYWYTGFEAV